MMWFQLFVIKVLVKALILTYSKAQEIIKKSLPADRFVCVQTKKIVLKNGTALLDAI